MPRNKGLDNIRAALLIVFMTTLSQGVSAQHNYKSLYAFSGSTDGNAPWAGLTLDQAGNLYGTTTTGGTSIFAGTVFKVTPDVHGVWTESVLYNFCSLSNCADGAQPFDSLTFDQSGNLYGTTSGGGTGEFCGFQGGCGVVFELTPHSDGSWSESVLYSFCSQMNCTDGDFPIGAPIFDRAGNLYDMTVGGGKTAASCGAGGCGVVFELTPHSDGSWSESVLHSFCSFTNCTDGFEPQSGLTFDANENLYGTAGSGGRKSTCMPVGCGVVFKLTQNPHGTWTDEVLHRFAGKDGEFPTARVIFDEAGSLYGITEVGGGLNDCNDCGIVFELTPNTDGTWTERVLHRFSGGRDGSFPHGELIFGQGGALYGTTASGGKGHGVVFKLAANSKGEWNKTILYDFVNRPGAQPLAGLIFDTAGNLYGTTVGDGATTFGSVFKITP